MKQLLAIEWMKVKSYRTFWVLMGLFVVALIGINYISFRVNREISENLPVSGFLTNPFSYPKIWETISWMSSFVLYFPGFIMILLISNEYTYKTHRQNIIDGWSRRQFVMVKLGVAFLMAVSATLLVVLSVIIFGLASGNGVSFNGIQGAGYFFVTSWIYMLFALLLGFLFRKAVLAIGIFFIYGLIIDNVIPLFLSYQLKGNPVPTYFMPLDVADGLLKHPFRKETENFLKSPNTYICLVICAAWIVFYHWFTNRKFHGEDL